MSSVKTPARSHKLDLRDLAIYGLALQFSRRTWGHLANIFSDTGMYQAGLKLSSSTRGYATVIVDGIKYGAFNHHYGKNCCYGYIRNREAVRIDSIFHVMIHSELGPDDTCPHFQAIAALIRPFQRFNGSDIMPWDHW